MDRFRFIEWNGHGLKDYLIRVFENNYDYISHVIKKTKVYLIGVIVDICNPRIYDMER